MRGFSGATTLGDWQGAGGGTPARVTLIKPLAPESQQGVSRTPAEGTALIECERPQSGSLLVRSTVQRYIRVRSPQYPVDPDGATVQWMKCHGLIWVVTKSVSRKSLFSFKITKYPSFLCIDFGQKLSSSPERHLPGRTIGHHRVHSLLIPPQTTGECAQKIFILLPKEICNCLPCVSGVFPLPPICIYLCRGRYAVTFDIVRLKSPPPNVLGLLGFYVCQRRTPAGLKCSTYAN